MKPRVSRPGNVRGSMERPEILNGIEVPYGLPIQELSQRVASPGPVAWAAITAVAHDSSEEALELLSELGRHGDWRIRRAAIEALGSHALGAKASGLIVDGLDDDVECVVRASCGAAAALALHEAHDRIAALLGAESETIREGAIRAIDALWQPGDAPVLLSMFQSDPVKSVRHEAGWSLMAHATKDNWLELFEAWVGDRLPRHRTWACRLFEEFGSPATRARVAALLQDSDGHVRQAAERALSHGKP